MTDVDGMPLLAECGQVTACIHDRACDAKAADHLERAVDSKTLGDTTEVNRDICVMKTDGMSVQELDRVERARPRGKGRLLAYPGQQSERLQYRRDRNVKKALGAPGQPGRGLRPGECPGMHGGRPNVGLAIETADIAVFVVTAHQPVTPCHRLERRIACSRHLRLGTAG